MLEPLLLRREYPEARSNLRLLALRLRHLIQTPGGARPVIRREPVVPSTLSFVGPAVVLSGMGAQEATPLFERFECLGIATALGLPRLGNRSVALGPQSGRVATLRAHASSPLTARSWRRPANGSEPGVRRFAM